MQSNVIDISGNGLETDDGCSLGQNLPLLVNLKALNISENNISDEATKSLTIGMLLTPNLKVFHCSKSLFSAESNMIFKMIYQLRITRSNNNFKCVPSESKALVFILKCISNLNEELQSSNIVSTVSHIETLEINHERATMDYKLTSDDLKELCTVLRSFKKLEVLDVRNNEITTEAKESVAKVMLQIHTFNNLKLNDNPIFNDELSMAVFNNIKNIRENKLKLIICNQKNFVHIESVIYILECLHQLENPTCFKSFNNITTLDINSQSNYGTVFLEYLNFLPFLKFLKVHNVKCITDHGIKQLNKYLSQNSILQTLDLSNCNLNNLEVEHRSKSNAISLEFVKFNHSNITDNALLKLSLNMLKLTNLNQLDLEGNNFGDKGITSLHGVLYISNPSRATITTLNLADNQLTDTSAPQIFKIVQICKVKHLNISCNCLGSISPYSTITTLEELNISQNDLNATAMCLGQQLHLLVNLKIFDITKSNISDEATKSLTTGMLLTPNLQEFKYDENMFSEDSTLIFKMMHRLRTTSDKKNFTCVPSTFKALVFILNCINDNEEKVQSSDIVSTISFIIELNLSHNEPATLDYKLTSEDFKKLYAVFRWFKSLEILDVRNNSITDEGMEPVVKMILQNRNLKITGNPICNDKFYMAVLDTINNARKERVQEITCNQNNHSHIACQSIIYIMECIMQLENYDCFELFNSITNLDVDSKSSDAGKFLEYLTLLPSLRILKINHVMCITNDGIIQLGKYLSQNSTLQTLDLSYCNLSNLEVKHRSKSNGISLESVKFYHSNITDNALFKLSLNMLKFTNLDQLDLEGNNFGDKGITSLHGVLYITNPSWATVTTLNLADNQLTDTSAPQIFEIVKICKVKHLNISCNCLGSISPYSTITTLEELNISQNDLNATAMCLGQQLHLLVNLKIFDITKAIFLMKQPKV